MKTKLLLSIVFVLFAFIFTTKTVSAFGQYKSGAIGEDLSVAQCNKKLTTPKVVTFGIIDVNNGGGFTTNGAGSSCLTKEASHFPKNLSLFVEANWNINSPYDNLPAASPLTSCTAGDENCLAYNYGYHAGLNAFQTASGVNLHSNTWWIDVVTTNTWNTNQVENQNSILGEYNALKASGIPTVGIYSTNSSWQTITGVSGQLQQLSLPNWNATLENTHKKAAKFCTKNDFTGPGGVTYLVKFRAYRVYAC